MTSRGIRNNNPGNIEYGPFARSQGATGSDGRFAVFPTPEKGIAALQALQTQYETKHGLSTPQERINRWAPAFENNVSSYANAVARGMGVGVNDPFSFVDANMNDDVQFVAAMIRHENGSQPYSLDQIRTALANGAVPRPTSAAKAAAAASGLQGYLPASQVPEPRLRPSPETPGPLLFDQLDRSSGTAPVPPLGIPGSRPDYAVPPSPQAPGGDAVIKAVLAGDPAALSSAANDALGGNALMMMLRAGPLTDYFTNFAKTQPALANQLAANLRGNSALLAAIPEAARGSVVAALSAPGAALPGSQVPMPTPRPATSSVPSVPTSIGGRYVPPSAAVSAEQRYRDAAIASGVTGPALDNLMETYRNRDAIVSQSTAEQRYREAAGKAGVTGSALDDLMKLFTVAPAAASPQPKPSPTIGSRAASKLRTYKPSSYSIADIFSSAASTGGRYVPPAATPKPAPASSAADLFTNSISGRYVPPAPVPQYQGPFGPALGFGSAPLPVAPKPTASVYVAPKPVAPKTVAPVVSKSSSSSYSNPAVKSGTSPGGTKYSVNYSTGVGSYTTPSGKTFSYKI